MRYRALLVFVVSLVAVGRSIGADKPAGFEFDDQPGRLLIRVGDQPIATYVYADEQIPRPHFKQVATTTGTPVTRHNPPREGVDLADHAQMHPGIWLAFGDLSGADCWRLKARVEHLEFTKKPGLETGVLTFGVRNRYLDATGAKTLCLEQCDYRFEPVDIGYRIRSSSVFSNAERDFTFGDQEELGLGARLATPLVVNNGGHITDSAGRRDEAGIRGHQADWCDYSRVIDNRRVGVLLVPGKENFGRSWFHIRNYGLMVANPFGREALGGGEPSRVTVKAGEPFRLAFSLLIYDCDPSLALDAIAGVAN